MSCHTEKLKGTSLKSLQKLEGSTSFCSNFYNDFNQFSVFREHGRCLREQTLYFVVFDEFVSIVFVFCSRSFSRSPLEQLEVEKEERELKLKKMQQDMEQVFELKVKEKKKKLKDSEAEVSQAPFDFVR